MKNNIIKAVLTLLLLYTPIATIGVVIKYTNITDLTNIGFLIIFGYSALYAALWEIFCE